MSYLTDLDGIKDQLAAQFPGWRIWYVPHSIDRGVTWCAQPKPTLNADSPEHLAEYMTEAQAENVGGVFT
jgi:hypothetical protein